MTESIYHNTETPVILKQQLFLDYFQSCAIKRIKIGKLNQEGWVGLRQALIQLLKKKRVWEEEELGSAVPIIFVLHPAIW